MDGALLWRDLGAALALVLVFEGLIPLISPSTAKRTGAMIAALDERVLRGIGSMSIAAGLLGLWLVRG